jgi:hypothetical protein
MSVPVVAALKLPKFSSRAVNESVGWVERERWESVGVGGSDGSGSGGSGSSGRWCEIVGDYGRLWERLEIMGVGGRLWESVGEMGL